MKLVQCQQPDVSELYHLLHSEKQNMQNEMSRGASFRTDKKHFSGPP